VNSVWGGAPPKYKCKECNRICVGTADGYMPRHRPPKLRKLCTGTGDPVKYHKKVS